MKESYCVIRSMGVFPDKRGSNIAFNYTDYVAVIEVLRTNSSGKNNRLNSSQKKKLN